MKCEWMSAFIFYHSGVWRGWQGKLLTRMPGMPKRLSQDGGGGDYHDLASIGKTITENFVMEGYQKCIGAN